MIRPVTVLTNSFKIQCKVDSVWQSHMSITRHRRRRTPFDSCSGVMQGSCFQRSKSRIIRQRFAYGIHRNRDGIFEVHTQCEIPYLVIFWNSGSGTFLAPSWQMVIRLVFREHLRSKTRCEFGIRKQWYSYHQRKICVWNTGTETEYRNRDGKLSKSAHSMRNTIPSPDLAPSWQNGDKAGPPRTPAQQDTV